MKTKKFTREANKVSKEMKVVMASIIQPDGEVLSKPTMMCMQCFGSMQEDERSYMCSCGYREVK